MTTTHTPKRPPLTVAEALRNIAREELERRRHEKAALFEAAQPQQRPETDASP